MSLRKAPFLGLLFLSLGASALPLGAVVQADEVRELPECHDRSLDLSEHLRFQVYTSTRTAACSVAVRSAPVLAAGANPGDRFYATNSRKGILIITTSEEIPGETRLSHTTGTRSFLFFPRRDSARVEENLESKTVELVLINGERLSFDGETGRIRGYSGGEVREAPAIHLRNQGGVEFGTPRAGLLMDCGWAQGRVAYENPRGTCRIIDSRGASCSLVNERIFNYRRLPNGSLLEAEFKFLTDTDFATFLKTACPTLDATWQSVPSTPSASAPAPESAPAATSGCAVLAPIPTPASLQFSQEVLRNFHDLKPR